MDAKTCAAKREEKEGKLIFLLPTEDSLSVADETVEYITEEVGLCAYSCRTRE